jgi:hypothetical protein
MTRAAASLLAEMPPVTITLGRVLYHPEAIMLALRTPRRSSPSATQPCKPHDWPLVFRRPIQLRRAGPPHITICYSTSDRPAQPLIDALGLQLPSCDIQVGALSVVIQYGPKRTWNWSVIDTVHL